MAKRTRHAKIETQAPALAANDELLLTPDAAKIIGAKPQTLNKWRCTGAPQPPYIRVGRMIRYRRSALESWLRARTVQTASL